MAGDGLTLDPGRGLDRDAPLSRDALADAKTFADRALTDAANLSDCRLGPNYPDGARQGRNADAKGHAQTQYQISDACQQTSDGAVRGTAQYGPGMQGIGKRLREARLAAKLSQAVLAERAGLTQPAIAEIESGRTRNSPHIVRLAKALSVEPDWLAGTPAPPKKSDDIIDVAGAEYARLPVYDIRFAAGAGAQNDDETPIDYYLIGMPLLRGMTDAPVKDIAVFQADGDSMEPTIHSRDWVFVDMRKKRLTNPGIYALVFEGDGLLKRAAQHLETGAVTLISDNAKYPPQTIKKPERLTVVGRVFLSIRRH